MEKSRLVLDAFESAAAVYDGSPFFPICGRRLVELAQIPLGATVLDIATGTGAVLFPALEQVGPTGRVTGIDIAESMVRAAAAKIRESHSQNAEVRQMNAESLQFPNESFERVLCGFALWFIPGLDAALNEMRRVLRPGGRIAVSTWAPPSELDRQYADLLRSYGAGSPDLSSHALSEAQAVKSALQTAGLEVIYATGEDVSVVYADEESWWSQRMACPQINTERLEPDALRDFKERAFKMVQAFKGPDGIHQTRTAIFAVAIPPQ